MCAKGSAGSRPPPATLEKGPLRKKKKTYCLTPLGISRPSRPSGCGGPPLELLPSGSVLFRLGSPAFRHQWAAKTTRNQPPSAALSLLSSSPLLQSVVAQLRRGGALAQLGRLLPRAPLLEVGGSALEGAAPFPTWLQAAAVVAAATAAGAPQGAGSTDTERPAEPTEAAAGAAGAPAGPLGDAAAAAVAAAAPAATAAASAEAGEEDDEGRDGEGGEAAGAAAAPDQPAPPLLGVHPHRKLSTPKFRPHFTGEPGGLGDGWRETGLPDAMLSISCCAVLGVGPRQGVRVGMAQMAAWACMLCCVCHAVRACIGGMHACAAHAPPAFFPRPDSSSSTPHEQCMSSQVWVT